MTEKIISVYIIFINVLGFVMMGVDKNIAKKNGDSGAKRMRIPEATLFTAALLLGGVGCCVGMKVFHHKTKKLKFYIGMPLAVILNIVTLYFINRFI